MENLSFLLILLWFTFDFFPHGVGWRVHLTQLHLHHTFVVYRNNIIVPSRLEFSLSKCASIDTKKRNDDRRWCNRCGYSHGYSYIFNFPEYSRNVNRSCCSLMLARSCYDGNKAVAWIQSKQIFYSTRTKNTIFFSSNHSMMEKSIRFPSVRDFSYWILFSVLFIRFLVTWITIRQIKLPKQVLNGWDEKRREEKERKKEQIWELNISRRKQ